MKYLFFTLASLTILATIVSMIYRKSWWIRIFDFPRAQIIIVQVISIVGIILTSPAFDLLTGVFLVPLLITTGIQLTYIFPYLPLARKDLSDSPPNPDKTISLMFSNVLMENRESNKLVELVHTYQPDIFLAVETDHWWEKAFSGIDKIYDFTVKKPLDNTYGMLLYSKLPLKDPKIKNIIKPDIPSIHTDVLIQDFTFKLRCLHPEPPIPEEAKTSKPRDRELLRIANLIRKKSKPHIVLGDLNDVAWSNTSYKFERISQLKDPRKGRGFYNTYHAKYPFFRWALDHIFVSNEFKILEIKRLPDVNSDHFPMYFKFGVNSANP